MTKLAGTVVLLCSVAVAQAQTTADQKTTDSQKRKSVATSLSATAEHKGAWDLGIWGDGGHTVSGGVSKTTVGNINLRVGKILTEEHGSGWYRGNFEYAVDLIPMYLFSGPFKPLPTNFLCPIGLRCPAPVTNDVVYGGGFNPFVVKWNFTSNRRISPYFELAGGVLFTNHEVPAFTSNINFASQAAIGLNIFHREHQAISLDFRYAHISNAGLASPNPGLNTIQGGIGYHWWK
jgi:hypothetical protein